MAKEKEKKPTALQDGLAIAIGCAFLAIAIFAAFVLPILLLPAALIGGGIYWYFNNPARHEAIARQKTEMLRKLVTAPTNDIEGGLLHHLRDLPRDAQLDLLDIGRRMYQVEGVINVPPMPAICNSIEGARYRDTLARIGATSNERENEVLRAISFIVAYCYKEHPMTPERFERVVGYVEGKRTLLPNLHDWFSSAFAKGVDDDFKEKVSDTLIEEAMNVERPAVELAIPEVLRTQHMHVVATTGWGKSQLFQSMVLADLETDAAIVIIDSQNDLINTIATRVPADRLILVDPETCPPALNIFASKPDDAGTAIELLEYVFSALDAGLTSKQGMVYRYLCRLMFAIPGANIHTLRKLLEPEGADAYQKEIDGLGETVRSFFAEYQRGRGNQYADTKQEVLRRLLTVLENETFEKMLAADRMSIDIEAALDTGKVILISTAKRHLRQTGAALFGRIFIAQVMQSVMARQGNRRRTYLYLDEFQDYAEDSPILFNLFEQSRKYGLGMVCAHQYLDQLPPKLRASMAANTAIKFAGGVSVGDARSLAPQMRTTADFMASLPRGTFAAHFQGQEAVAYPVEFGRMEKLPQLERLADIQARMREKYGPKSRPDETHFPSPPDTPPPPINPANATSPEEGRGGKRFLVNDD